MTSQSLQHGGTSSKACTPVYLSRLNFCNFLVPLLLLPPTPRYSLLVLPENVPCLYTFYFYCQDGLSYWQIQAKILPRNPSGSFPPLEGQVQLGAFAFIIPGEGRPESATHTALQEWLCSSSSPSKLTSTICRCYLSFPSSDCLQNNGQSIPDSESVC